MFADEFALSCLNRLQLRNNQQMVDLADPSAALQLRRHAGEPDRMTVFRDALGHPARAGRQRTWRWPTGRAG